MKYKSALKPYQFIASVFGIGYIKGGGTIAAAVAALGWYLLTPEEGSIQLLLCTAVFFAGVLAANKTDILWGKDSSKVVIDEVLGMMVAVLLLPKTASVVIGSFILFRLFDIFKPLGIRRAERLKKGWGVMIDDLWAGVYANIGMQLVVYAGLLKQNG